MSSESLRKTLETKMAGGWTTTPVKYENNPFTKPSKEWVRFTLIEGEGRTAGGGSSVCVRDSGLISLQIFVLENKGTATSNTLKDSFKTLFEHKRITDLNGGRDIKTYSASVIPVGVSSGWHQTNITIPYRRDRNV
ncbi:MAG: hypothetical protein COB36_10750 [Alphaproteobacteria bacterium]|nr:MAG: hypothetical protein COB36_10750 [Alphaproteobacteria bacterium]